MVFNLRDESASASSSDSNSTDYGLKHGHLIVNDNVHKAHKTVGSSDSFASDEEYDVMEDVNQVNE